MQTATRLPDWEAGPIAYPLAKKVSLVIVLAGPLFLFFFGFSLLDGGWEAGSLVATLFWISFLGINQWRATKSSALRGVKTEPLDDPRFENLVRGLVEQRHLPNPELLVIEEGGPNALVMRGPRPRLAVTRSLLETFTRTEQEAVAAHCLLRLASGQAGFIQLASSLGRSGSRFAPKIGYEDDVHAAALTRYPPALADAITKAKPAEGVASPFWFVAHDPSHRHPTERAAALKEL